MRKLRTERAKAGLTLRELSQRTGLSITTISMIERGEQRPRATMLKRLADGLSVPVEALVEEVEDRPLAGTTSASR